MTFHRKLFHHFVCAMQSQADARAFSLLEGSASSFCRINDSLIVAARVDCTFSIQIGHVVWVLWHTTCCCRCAHLFVSLLGARNLLLLPIFVFCYWILCRVASLTISSPRVIPDIGSCLIWMWRNYMLVFLNKMTRVKGQFFAALIKQMLWMIWGWLAWGIVTIWCLNCQSYGTTT